MSCPELPARIDASALTSQPFAVEKLGTCEIDRDLSSSESVNRLDIELFQLDDPPPRAPVSGRRFLRPNPTRPRRPCRKR